MNHDLLTPVVLFAFNRPELTAQVFEAIRLAKPKVLFVIIDGPRAGNQSDRQLSDQVIKIVSQVDWACEVTYEIAETNMGIRKRFVTGLGDVFAKVDEAIIVEDDCLPNSSFFYFQQEMLSRYRDDPSVGLVCGFNPLGSISQLTDSHLFSSYSAVWGWGTWKRVWETYDSSASDWLTPKGRRAVYSQIRSSSARRFWSHNFNLVAKNSDYSTWDYQLIFNQMLHHRKNIFPKSSLVSNLGFSIDANHTMDVNHPLALITSEELRMPFTLNVPEVVSDEFDQMLEREVYNLSLPKYWLLNLIHTLPSEKLQRLVFRSILKIRSLISGQKE